MVRAGLTQSYVARFYHIPRSTITTIVGREKHSEKSIVKKKGRRLKLTSRCTRRLLRILHENRFKPLHVTAAQFRNQNGEEICMNTIRSYIKRQGFNGFIAVSKPYLSAKHIVARHQWANEHRSWTDEQWANVAFRDESSFTIRPTTLRKRVWRKVGGRSKTENLVPTFKSGYVTLSVWAAFSIHGRTPLVRISGTLNQHKYEEILEGYIVPFANAYQGGTGGFIFQQDNCGPHKAKSIKSFIYSSGIQLLPWPSQSPDMNPIENAWAILKRELRQRTTYSNTVDGLFNELCNIWNSLPDSYFKSLVKSMPNRVRKLKNVRGRSTKT